MSAALLLVVTAWAAMLGMSVFRSVETSPQVTVGGFERTMQTLGNDTRGRRSGATAPASAVRREDPVIAARRTRFVRLLIAVGVLLALAVWFGGLWWTAWLATLVGTGGYVAYLRRLKVQRDEAREVVRELHLRPPDLEHDVYRSMLPTAAGAESMAGMLASTTVRLRRWDE